MRAKAKRHFYPYEDCKDYEPQGENIIFIRNNFLNKKLIKTKGALHPFSPISERLDMDV